MQDPNTLDTKAERESKKKKSAFRITSIIDPVKNDDEDEDKVSIVDGSEESYTASRFRVIKSQTPNPRTFYSGRWKVKETYMVELSNHKEEKLSGASATSNDSCTGDNGRCVTPHSQTSNPHEHRSGSPPKFDTAFLESYESHFAEHMQQTREKLTSIHAHSAAISKKYDDLKAENERLKEENTALREENKRLSS